MLFQHRFSQEITDAIRWGRLYGGCLALMVIDGEGDRLDLMFPDGVLRCLVEGKS